MSDWNWPRNPQLDREIQQANLDARRYYQDRKRREHREMLWDAVAAVFIIGVAFVAIWVLSGQGWPL